jgi:hypothetical protein
MRSNFGKGHTRALTESGDLIAEGDLLFAIVDKPETMA